MRFIGWTWKPVRCFHGRPSGDRGNLARENEPKVDRGNLAGFTDRFPRSPDGRKSWVSFPRVPDRVTVETCRHGLTSKPVGDRVDVETTLDQQVDVETSSLRKATVETRRECGATWKPVGHRATVETGSQLAGFGPRGSQLP